MIEAIVSAILLLVVAVSCLAFLFAPTNYIAVHAAVLLFAATTIFACMCVFQLMKLLCACKRFENYMNDMEVTISEDELERVLGPDFPRERDNG